MRRAITDGRPEHVVQTHRLVRGVMDSRRGVCRNCRARNTALAASIIVIVDGGSSDRKHVRDRSIYRPEQSFLTKPTGHDDCAQTQMDYSDSGARSVGKTAVSMWELR